MGWGGECEESLTENGGWKMEWGLGWVRSSRGDPVGGGSLEGTNNVRTSEKEEFQ